MCVVLHEKAKTSSVCKIGNFKPIFSTQYGSGCRSRNQSTSFISKQRNCLPPSKEDFGNRFRFNFKHLTRVFPSRNRNIFSEMKGTWMKVWAFEDRTKLKLFFMCCSVFICHFILDAKINVYFLPLLHNGCVF